jgi:putative transposase
VPNMFENIILDEYVIMPNHIHGVLTFLDTPYYRESKREASLSEVIRAFKAKSTKLIRDNKIELVDAVSPVGRMNAAPTHIWQDSFYDHVIRNEPDLQRIREYIFNNPLQWELDELNPVNRQEDRVAVFR